ncbi:arginine-hydroxylase NDUFAF5, mitochondrial [Bacillus rossius redtenbacheri]|uniref:arginine-hydroxylase NDUFAF5, mitochondrial n=1 Tax=Bacillus rossius redtenbacheri TaxID=93214 RepID=UPI002FDCCDDE
MEQTRSVLLRLCRPSSALARRLHLDPRLAQAGRPAPSIFCRRAKLLQRERAARAPDAPLYDYLKDEVGARLADRVLDIRRDFAAAANLGCGRGHVSRHLPAERVGRLYLCDACAGWLEAAPAPEGVSAERRAVDEEGPLPFAAASLDLVISSLALHWVNDLPAALGEAHRCLREDGALLTAMFGGDTLYELRSALQLANLERRGGAAPHVSPFAQVRDVGALLTQAGFTMLTIDTDELVVGYPSMLELMGDLKGMGESNAALRRALHLGRERLVAAASVYDRLYGRDEAGRRSVPATFQVIYALGWKPSASQPRPLARGSGQVSLRDLHRLDEIIRDSKKVPLDPE